MGQGQRAGTAKCRQPVKKGNFFYACEIVHPFAGASTAKCKLILTH